jgi:uncharacterized protein (TIGR02594 family)
MTIDIRQLQTKLGEIGYMPGPIDGAFGRLTIAALKHFQRDHAIAPNGIANAETIQALFYEGVAIHQPALALTVPPWLSEVRRKTGLTEAGPGRFKLIAWLRSDHNYLGDPAKYPWCGELVATAIALTLPDEALPSNPYWALNWSAFGRPVSPSVGAILVFHRPGGGHVGFCEGQAGDHWIVRGGNQSDSISVARVAKARCVAIRWPATYPMPSTPAWTTGTNAAGVAITRNEA